MADNEIEFVNGLIVKPPHANAPDFVKCAISIKVADLTVWLATKYDDWSNSTVNESKVGRCYAAVSHFRPKQQNAPQETKPGANVPAAEYDSDPIPF